MNGHQTQPMTPRVKICGITNVNDAITAVRAGADAIGLVFYASSPRAITVKQAREITEVAGPFVTVVGLFVDEDADNVQKVLEAVPLQVLQFHGNESPDFCQQFHRPWIKALRMKADIDVSEEAKRFNSSVGILVDTYDVASPGGTGKTFSWDRLPESLTKPLVLAGGLSPDNVAEAVTQIKPYAVDVSSGVEKSPGQKDAEKVKNFIDAVKQK